MIYYFGIKDKQSVLVLVKLLKLMIIMLSHPNFKLKPIVYYESNMRITISQSYDKSAEILERLQKSPQIKRIKR